MYTIYLQTHTYIYFICDDFHRIFAESISCAASISQLGIAKLQFGPMDCFKRKITRKLHWPEKRKQKLGALTVYS